MEKDKLIQTIYESSGMGIDVINTIRDQVEDEELKQLIVNQREGYQKMHEKAKFELEEMGINELKEQSDFSKWMIKGQTKIKSSINKSNSNIAKMMVDGTNMGVENLSRSVNKMNEANEKIPHIYNEYKSMLDSNMTELHKFL